MAQTEDNINIYYDIELIDVSDNIENFKFSKLSSKDLQKLLKSFKKEEHHYEFDSHETHVLMRSEHIRGIMYHKYNEKEKTSLQENQESAIEVSKVNLKKTIFNSTGETL